MIIVLIFCLVSAVGVCTLAANSKHAREKGDELGCCRNKTTA